MLWSTAYVEWGARPGRLRGPVGSTGKRSSCRIPKHFRKCKPCFRSWRPLHQGLSLFRLCRQICLVICIHSGLAQLHLAPNYGVHVRKTYCQSLFTTTVFQRCLTPFGHMTARFPDTGVATSHILMDQCMRGSATFTTRECGLVIASVTSVCVCPFRALTFESLDAETSFWQVVKIFRISIG